VKRALLSLVSLLPLPPLTLVQSGCDRRATSTQCTEMLEKYVDMTSAAEPALADLRPDDPRIFAARELAKAKKKEDPSFRRVQAQCEAEVTQREYRCAMKAPNPETWQACID